VSSLRAGISRNGGSNAGGDKRFCSLNHLYRLRFPPDLLLNGYLRFKRAGRETDHSYHKVLWLRISGALPPASDMLSWYLRLFVLMPLRQQLTRHLLNLIIAYKFNTVHGRMNVKESHNVYMYAKMADMFTKDVIIKNRSRIFTSGHQAARACCMWK
jgi:hypothetical protein